MIYPSLWWSKPLCPRNPTTTANFVECSMRLFTKLLVKKFAFEISEDIAILMTSGLNAQEEDWEQQYMGVKLIPRSFYLLGLGLREDFRVFFTESIRSETKNVVWGRKGY